MPTEESWAFSSKNVACHIRPSAVAFQGKFQMHSKSEVNAAGLFRKKKQQHTFYAAKYLINCFCFYFPLRVQRSAFNAIVFSTSVAHIIVILESNGFFFPHGFPFVWPQPNVKVSLARIFPPRWVPLFSHFRSLFFIFFFAPTGCFAVCFVWFHSWSLPHFLVRLS